MSDIIGGDALSRLLAASAMRPFQFGEHDCLLFPADRVLGVTGIDPAARFRGKYSSEKGALAILSAHGGAIALIEECVAPLGIKRVASATARRGDIAVVDMPEGAMGAIVLTGSVACLWKQGLAVYRAVLAPILAAWRVG